MHNFEDGKLFTTEEAKQLRENILRESILPRLEKRFAKYPTLKSAGMFIAQYWCDEAEDAVHLRLFFSVLETPDYKSAFACESGLSDPVNLPDLPINTWIFHDEKYGGIPWDDNGITISAFAGFCRDGCHHEMKHEEAYSLYAIFRKNGNAVDVEYWTPMIRPWLDGICPQSFEELDLEEVLRIKAEYLQPLT